MSLAPYRLVYMPVGFAEAADRIVALVERGVVAVQDHWLSREACQTFIDRQPRLLHASYAPTAAIVRVAEGAQRVGPGAFAGDQRGNDVSRSLGFPLAGGAGLNGTVLAPTASTTDRRDGGCVSGNPDPVSEEDGASTRADADRRRCNRAALLRSNSVEGRHVA